MTVNFTEVSNGDLQCASHSAAEDLTVGGTLVRRRHERWPEVERARITAESFSSGEPIAQVARRNGVSLGLLHYWRRHAREIGTVEELRFVPVTVADHAAPGTGNFELTVRDVMVRIDGDVDIPRLRAVLQAIRA